MNIEAGNTSDEGTTDVQIDALHASSIKAMSAFVHQPSATAAQLVLRLLSALANHPDRFIAPCGFDVYQNVLPVWNDLARHMHQCAANRGHQNLH